MRMRQIPPQDFDSNYCYDLDDVEKQELLCYVTKVQEDAIGKGVEKRNNFEHDLVSN